MQIIDLSEATAARRRIWFEARDSNGDPVTGLTGTGYISKNGATPEASTNSLVEVSDTLAPGDYYLEATATEVNTEGVVRATYLDAGINGGVMGTTVLVLNRLTEQGVADADLLAPVGTAAAGSLHKKADDILADTSDLESEWNDGGRLDNLLDAADVTTQMSSLKNLGEDTWYGTVVDVTLDVEQFTVTLVDGAGNDVTAQVSANQQLQNRNIRFRSNTSTIALRGQGGRINSAVGMTTYVILNLPTEEKLSVAPAAGDVITISTY